MMPEMRTLAVASDDCRIYFYKLRGTNKLSSLDCVHKCVPWLVGFVCKYESLPQTTGWRWER